jgi:translation initiation factor IF-2
MSENIKVFELAKEFDLKALDLIEKIKHLNLKIKNHMAEITPEQAEAIRQFMRPPVVTTEADKKKTVVRKSAKDKVESKVNAVSRSVVIKKAVTLVKKEKETDNVGHAAMAEQAPANDQETLDLKTSSEAPIESAQESFSSTKNDDTITSSSEKINLSQDADTLAEKQIDPQVNEAIAKEFLNAEDSEKTVTEKQESLNQSVQDVASPEATPAVAPRRGPRYSIIRVVSVEPEKHKKPLIVEDAPSGGLKTKSAVPKTFADPELSKSASALIKEIEAEEELRRKKSVLSPRAKNTDESALFKSTDYLRRERVYQPKKKKISIGGRTVSGGKSASSIQHKRLVEFQDRISVENIAEQLAVKFTEVLKKLTALGVSMPDEVMGANDWFLDLETAQLIAQEFDAELEDQSFKEEEILSQNKTPEADKNLKPRSPVITIMGHVDHGKTSLLDALRKARVADGEAGGITQHIGAYTVQVADAIKNLKAKKEASALSKDNEKSAKKDKKKLPNEKTKDPVKGGDKKLVERLTFLDTPGHAAFSSMRSRGAKITDIVILVVSAVDGVMPQTREAVDHAKAAQVPLIVAVNKIDLPEANLDKIKKQLGDLNIVPEEWGGDTIFVNVSAKTGEGLDTLIEMICVQAEMLELKANPDGPARGSIIEAKLDKGRGPAATVLVQEGELSVGEYIVAGTQMGRVRALIDDKGVQVKKAGPSTPVEILGLSGVPDAGDSLNKVNDERAARALVEHRIQLQRQEHAAQKTFSVEELMSRMAEGEVKELPVILKADVKGSAEAIHAALVKIPDTKVRLKILSVAVGGITESDVLLASASKALILGFNVRPDNKAHSESERLGVQIRTFTIIYDLLENITTIMEGMLAPTYKETLVGRAEVRNVFNLTKSGTVAGCMVIKGKIMRNNTARLIRDGRVIYTGKLSGLKRFKDDAREVAEGIECGISIENYQDIKTGDVIESIFVETVVGRLATDAQA